MMTKRKDGDNKEMATKREQRIAPLTFHFSKPANDNQSPLMKRILAWGAVAIGLGSIVALLVL